MIAKLLGRFNEAISHAFVTVMACCLRITGRRTPEISTHELARRLSESPPSVLLIDVRSKAETSVSKIDGAITEEQYAAREPQRDRDRMIVAYCTIGGRSLLYASRLRAHKQPAVNYRAGILGWCQANGKLVDAQGNPTTRLHTHSRFFRAPDGYTRVTGKQ